jgi:hypothetical protein
MFRVLVFKKCACCSDQRHHASYEKTGNSATQRPVKSFKNETSLPDDRLSVVYNVGLNGAYLIRDGAAGKPGKTIAPSLREGAKGMGYSLCGFGIAAMMH